MSTLLTHFLQATLSQGKCQQLGQDVVPGEHPTVGPRLWASGQSARVEGQPPPPCLSYQDMPSVPGSFAACPCPQDAVPGASAGLTCLSLSPSPVLPQQPSVLWGPSLSLSEYTPLGRVASLGPEAPARLTDCCSPRKCHLSLALEDGPGTFSEAGCRAASAGLAVHWTPVWVLAVPCQPGPDSSLPASHFLLHKTGISIPGQ